MRVHNLGCENLSKMHDLKFFGYSVSLTYKIFQLLARKQHIGESLEPFHSVLSGLAARGNFGTLETRILRDVFIVNINDREAQNELC